MGKDIYRNGVHVNAVLATPPRKHRLYALHRMPTFGGTGLADVVLIAKQTDLVEGVGRIHGVYPFTSTCPSHLQPGRRHLKK
jgi:hypothetical protein